MAKFKFLRFQVPKDYNTGEIVAQVNVSDYNKKGIDKLWDELELKYPKDKYVSSLITTTQLMREFQN